MATQPSSEAVVHVESDDHFETLIDSAQGGLVVADFSAVWCGPCRRIAPFYEQLAQARRDALFLKIDVDECPETAGKWQVRAFPTFLFFKDGLKAGEVKGAQPEQLQQTVADLAALPAGAVAAYFVQSGQAEQAGLQ